MYVCVCIYYYMLYIPLVFDVYAVVCGKGVPSLLLLNALFSCDFILLEFLFFVLSVSNELNQKRHQEFFFFFYQFNQSIHALLEFTNSFRGCWIENGTDVICLCCGSIFFYLKYRMYVNVYVFNCATIYSRSFWSQNF